MPGPTFPLGIADFASSAYNLSSANNLCFPFLRDNNDADFTSKAYNLSFPLGIDNNDADVASSAYNLLFLLTGLVIAAYSIARYAEYRNHFNYENRSARIIYGLINIITETLHTRSSDSKITGYEGQILVVGPHRTGLLDGATVASKMRGEQGKQAEAPHFFATDVYNSIPGAECVMKMLNAITIKANSRKTKEGQSAHAHALEQAGQVLRNKGCLILFPQGNFSKIGQEPFGIFNGAARLAVQNNAAIRVIRLDGLWSIDNPFIPVFIRNNSYYRALGSFFHMNNVRVTECRVIDFHLKDDESAGLNEAQKIDKIGAQIYAFYRQTENLPVDQIRAINRQVTNVSDKTHLLIWNNKLARDQLTKQLTAIDKERNELETTALTSMSGPS